MTDCPMTDLGSLFSTAVRDCPIPFLRKLQEQAPIYRDPLTGFYILTRYADVAHVADRPQIFSSENEILLGRSNSPVAEEVHRRFRERGFPELHTLATADPPVHTKYRRLVEKAFTPSLVKALEPKVYRAVDALIDTFVADGKVDLAWQFAFIVSMHVIIDQLGFDREDWRQIRRWADCALERADPSLSAERELLCTEGMIEMQQYLFSYVRKFREQPNDSLFSRLVNVEDAGEKLSDRALMSIGHQLLVGGSETTGGTILAVMSELLAAPGLLERVRADIKLIPALISEVLRLQAPVPNSFRIVKSDVEIGGVKIPAGSTVVISWMAANYDPDRFQNPTELDLGRSTRQPHLSFGRGVHFCVGNLLAKTEARIAIERLVTRLPNMRLSPSHPAPKFVPHAFVHAPDQVHIEFDVPQLLPVSHSSTA